MQKKTQRSSFRSKGPQRSRTSRGPSRPSQGSRSRTSERSGSSQGFDSLNDDRRSSQEGSRKPFSQGPKSRTPQGSRSYQDFDSYEGPRSSREESRTSDSSRDRDFRGSANSRGPRTSQGPRDFKSNRTSPSRPAQRPQPQTPAPKTGKSAKNGELIYGIHPIVELLKAKRRKLISIYTTKPTPKAWEEIAKLLPSYVPVNYVTRESLFNIAQTSDHQGVVAWAQPFIFRRKFFDADKQKFLVMLDGIQDSRNLGAIIRSAYCTNVDGVILIERGAAPLNAAAIKSSAGLAEHLEVYLAPSAQAAALELKKAGYTMYLATFKGESAMTVNYLQPLCMVIGGEGFGISKELFNAGIHVTLPQKSPDISYNASVAAGILLFWVASKNKRI